MTAMLVSLWVTRGGFVDPHVVSRENRHLEHYSDCDQCRTCTGPHPTREAAQEAADGHECPPRTRRRRWTEADDHAVRTLPAKAAAKRTGRSYWTILQRRRRLGITQPGRWTEDEDELVRTLDTAEAAAATGRTHRAVSERRRRIGVAEPRGAA